MEGEEKADTPLAPKVNDDSGKQASYGGKEETDSKPVGDKPPAYKRHFSVEYMKWQVQKAQKDSPNKGVFAIKLLEVLCGSAACTICFLLMAALPIAMIAIGSYYLHDCPGRDKIPIWLIVFGCFSLFQTLVNSSKRCFGFCPQRGDNGDEEGEGKDWGKNVDRGGGCCETLISLFLIAWLITGSVWVFGYWSQYQSDACQPDPDANDCCHPVPYLFSFISIIVMYAFGILGCIFFCCCFCVCSIVAAATAAAS